MRCYLFFFLLIFLYACNDTVHKKFDTYKDVQQQGYFQNGWIPSIIPTDAYQIKEVHDLDLNYAFGMFRYDSLQAFSAIFDIIRYYPLDSIKAYVKLINRPSKPDWFLNIDESTERQLDTKEWNDFKFIIDKENKTVYYVL